MPYSAKDIWIYQMDATMLAHIRKHTGREKNNPGDENPKGKAVFTQKRIDLSKFVATSKVTSVINQSAKLQGDFILQTHFRLTNRIFTTLQPCLPLLTFPPPPTTFLNGLPMFTRPLFCVIASACAQKHVAGLIVWTYGRSERTQSQTISQ